VNGICVPSAWDMHEQRLRCDTRAVRFCYPGGRNNRVEMMGLVVSSYEQLVDPVAIEVASTQGVRHRKGALVTWIAYCCCSSPNPFKRRRVKHKRRGKHVFTTAHVDVAMKFRHSGIFRPPASLAFVENRSLMSITRVRG
jgi:hypothetical protein